MEDFLFRNIFKSMRLIFIVCIDLHHLTFQMDVIRNKEHLYTESSVPIYWWQQSWKGLPGK